MTVCHLCGLPIPAWATTHHPLEKTRDHLVRRIYGGTGLPNNTLPAHRCCNEWRCHNPITPRLRRRCRRLAEAEFLKVGEPIPTVLVPTVSAVPNLPALVSATDSVAALPAHQRRAVIIGIVADLARAYVGCDAGIEADLPRLAQRVCQPRSEVPRYVAAPPRDVIRFPR